MFDIILYHLFNKNPLIGIISKEILPIYSRYMTWSDDEEEFGCYNVYLCKRCDDSKPRKDFYKSWDASKMETVYYKTCKDCREKRRVSAKIRYDKDKDKINEKRREYKKTYNQLEVFCDYCQCKVKKCRWSQHLQTEKHKNNETVKKDEEEKVNRMTDEEKDEYYKIKKLKQIWKTVWLRS